MNILILEDGKLMAGDSIGRQLASLLEEGGHKAHIFDGRLPPGSGVPMTVNRAAKEVYDIILTHAVTGFVLDLQWFTNPGYGDELWNTIRSPSGIYGLPNGSKAVVYSKFVTDDNRQAISDRLGIPVDLIFNRYTTAVEEIVNEFT